jgi:hypothetical protein
LIKLGLMNKIDEGLDELRELRKETINRWKKAGFLDRLKPVQSDKFKIFKTNKKIIIDENKTEMGD